MDKRIQKIQHIRAIKKAIYYSVPVAFRITINEMFKYAYESIDIKGAEDFSVPKLIQIGIAKFKRFKRTAYDSRYEQHFYNVVEYFLGWRLHHNVHSNKDEFGVPPEWLGGEGGGWTFKCSIEDHTNIIGKKLVEKFLEIAKKDKR